MVTNEQAPQFVYLKHLNYSCLQRSVLFFSIYIYKAKEYPQILRLLGSFAPKCLLREAKKREQGTRQPSGNIELRNSISVGSVGSMWNAWFIHSVIAFSVSSCLLFASVLIHPVRTVFRVRVQFLCLCTYQSLSPSLSSHTHIHTYTQIHTRIRTHGQNRRQSSHDRPSLLNHLSPSLPKWHSPC